MERKSKTAKGKKRAFVSMQPANRLNKQLCYKIIIYGAEFCGYVNKISIENDNEHMGTCHNVWLKTSINFLFFP